MLDLEQRVIIDFFQKMLILILIMKSVFLKKDY